MRIGQSGLNKATQQVLLEALPQILVLHLERFVYDAATEGINKISMPVRFAPELEIPIGTTFYFVSPMLPMLILHLSLGLEIMAGVSGKSTKPVHFKLHGVLYHRGESVGSDGHYTVDVLQQNGDSGGGEAWLHIDDEVVSAVRHEDVSGDNANERVNDRCAYMLFYCRTGSAT